MHALHIASDRFRPLGHGPIDPGTDLDIVPPHQLPAEAGRNFQGKGDLAVAHAPVQVRIVGKRLLLDEIAGARYVQDIVAADGRVVAIEDGEGQVLDIHVDAVTDHEHQDDAAEDGKRRADRIAP